MGNSEVEVAQSDAGRIVLVSTVTTDWVSAAPGDLPRPTRGGPAHYIALAFDLLNAPYRVLTNEVAEVYVTSGLDGETYCIPPIKPIVLPSKLDAAAVILSPIIQEIDPEKIPEISGLLVVDIQGFVRRPNVQTNETRGPFDLVSLVRRAHLVKASTAELALLDGRTRAALASRTTLITSGPAGAWVYAGERSYQVRSNPIEATNTIGAGDSFLAAMTWALVREVDLFQAADEAARFTEEMLLARGRV